MARKPPVKLPDVFAKPGRAPSRGTPIEALPQDVVVMPTVQEPRVADVAEPQATVHPHTTDLVEGKVALATDFPTTVNPQITDAVDGAAAPAADALTTVNPQATEKVVLATDFPTTVNPQVTDAVNGSAEPTAEALTTVNPQITDVAVDKTAPTADFSTTVGPQVTDTPAPVSAPDAEPAAWARPSTPTLALPVTGMPKPAPTPVVAKPAPEAVRPAPPAPEPPPVVHQTAHVPQSPTPPLPQPRGPAWAIAMVALGVSLTTPFWYDGALRVLGITTAINQAQQQDALAITRQERTLQDVQQRLTTANAQLSKARTDLTEAARQQEETAAWTRTMILVRLSEALRRGIPFVAEVAMVRSSGAATGDLPRLIERIAPYAPIGVPTAVDLANDFRRVTDPVLRPNRGFNPMAWAATVVAWTPFGRPAAETDPGRTALREAGARMRDGQINEAVAILRPVTGPVAEMMAGWLADTDARAAADTLGTRVDAMLRAIRR